MKRDIKRLVIISNRLPFVLEKSRKGWTVQPGSGGLVTALAPVLRDRGGLWIGWPGTAATRGISKLLESASKKIGYSLVPVQLNEEEISGYYRGMANEVIWPLFHDLQSYTNFEPHYWNTYCNVNRRFAEVTMEHVGAEDFIWVHDYHLINMAFELRRLGVKSKIGFFLHIPFPPHDIFVKLPWRREILTALLGFDIIGFQTLRDRRNFLHCLRTLMEDVSIQGKGQVVTVSVGGRIVRVGSFSISIDFDEFAQKAASEEIAETAWYLHENLPKTQIILGVDRLDYTKGIPYRLKAFRTFLERHRELHRKVTLVQIVVPSRRNIPMYEDLKLEIGQLVSEVNGEFTKSGWVPIHYIFHAVERRELLAYYRTAEIALITPLKDGMNLVAKEYCASSIEDNGVLILSEFAGAVAQLQHSAILVNPYDIEEMADAIYRAYTMMPDERSSRMKRLRHSIRKYNIYWWVNSFLEAAISGTLDNFPLLEDYIPKTKRTKGTKS